MQNPQDLKQALAAIEQEVQQKANVLKVKEEEVKKLKTELNAITAELTNMQREMEEKKRRATELRSKLPRAEADVVREKVDQQKTHMELVQITRKYSEALENSKVKLHSEIRKL